MYRSFEVRGFRCLRKLTLDSLERVNLIAGVNNVGKTALLEALFLHCGAYNPALTLSINAFRGIDSIKVELGKRAETPWDSLFSDFNVSQNVELEGENDVAEHRLLQLRVIRQPEELARLRWFIQRDLGSSENLPLTSKSAILSSTVVETVLELVYRQEGREDKYYMILDPTGLRTEPIPPPPPFPAFFLAARMPVSWQEDAELIGKLDIAGQQDVLVEALRVIEPKLRRLSLVVTGGVPMIHGDVGVGRLLPLPVMGEGMVRIASLVLRIANASGGVVLVDEIENGLHHSILPSVWQVIGKYARRFNTQVFATTHSLECITAAHEAFTQSELYDFRLHRLERKNEVIRAVTYDKEVLAAALETGLEVR
ncbi:MAG: AAA family ATPase [Blastocatellia bacterium]|nr:AAA family ATPase [Blastocatellia bacterium]